MNSPQRIVLTRLRFLGDVVLTTPLIAALRERFPAASLEYLVEEPFDEILHEHPQLDAVHVLAKGASPTEMFRLAERLRKPRVDWWIDLLTNPRSCMLALLARPRVGVGSDRGLRARVYAHRRRRPPGHPSAIVHHLDKLVPLVGEAPRPVPTSLHVCEARRLAARRKWELDPAAAPTLIHPGSTWPDKAWPQERWVELARLLEASATGPLWMLTPPGEEELATRLAERAGIRRLPVLRLGELLPLLAQARLLIGNDGGVIHCAVALSTPTLALFGPTDPAIWFPYEEWGPYRVLHDDRPHPSGDPKGSRLTGIDVGRVAATATALLSNTAEAGRA